MSAAQSPAPGNGSSGLDAATLQLLQSRALAGALAALYAGAAAVGLPGNLLSLWLLCRHVRPRSPSVLLMVNLALADLALAAVLPFQAAYVARGHHWALGAPLCTAVTLAFYVNMYCSVVTVTCLSVERCVGVLRPLAAARWRRRRWALLGCAAAWMLPLGALWPLARGDLTFRVAPLGVVTCFDVLRWTLLPGAGRWAAFLLTALAALFAVPCAVTVGCYVAVAARLLRRPPGRALRRSGALAAVVLAAFLGCFAPSHAALLAHVIGRLFLGRGCYAAYKLTLGLSCLNICLDPLVYYFASRDFRRCVRARLGRGGREGREGRGRRSLRARVSDPNPDSDPDPDRDPDSDPRPAGLPHTDTHV